MATTPTQDENELGDAPYVATDQVRFRSMRWGDVVALVDVPPIDS